MTVMKTFFAFSLLIFASTTTVYAHPATFELEIIESRGYIDVPLSLIQIRADDDQFERREDIAGTIQIETRGDGNGGQLTKAGDILDKVGTGLSVVSAAANAVPVLGQIESAALTVVKTAVAIFSKVLAAIGKAQHKDALKRGAFTQDVVQQTLQKHPGWNCIVVHTKHTKNFKGAEGNDWAHAHQELKTKFPVGSTIGFEIYTFREGSFELKGDGGYLNWAYGGQVTKGDAKSKKLTFGPSPNAKGTSTDAIKGVGKEAAKDAGKKAKQQEKAEKGGKKSAPAKSSPKKKKGRGLDEAQVEA